MKRHLSRPFASSGVAYLAREAARPAPPTRAGRAAWLWAALLSLGSACGSGNDAPAPGASVGGNGSGTGGSGGGGSSTAGAGGADGGAGGAIDVGNRTFSLEPLSGFAIPGGVPNAAWLPSEGRVVLLYSHAGLCEATSTDGVAFAGIGSVDTALTGILDGKGLMAVDVLVRESPLGRRYFMLGLPPPGSNQRDLYAADRPSGGTLALANGGAPVYSGGPPDAHSLGVPDIAPTPGGDLRLTYVSPFSGNGNCSTAVSADDGLGWTFEDDDPFADATGVGAAQVNVDPATLRLSDGTYVAVTMRAAELFFWNGVDGIAWTPAAGGAVNAALFAASAPAATGLFDPTLVELPSGELYLYVTAGGGAPGTEVIVAARVTPHP